MFNEICYGYLHGVQCDCCEMYTECFGNDDEEDDVDYEELGLADCLPEDF